MTSVAMLTSTAFWRRSRGSERRIADLTRAIAREGHAVTVIWAGRLSDEDRSIIERDRVSVEQTGVPLPSAVPNTSIAAFESGLFSESLAGALARTRPDILIAQYIRFSPAIRSLPQDIRPPMCIVDTHDVMHTRAAAFQNAGHAHWIDLTRTEEADALRVFDIAIAINSVDAGVFSDMIGADRVLRAPHAVTATPPNAPPANEPNVLFVGAAGVPNVDALHWLIDEIWPIARQNLGSNATLTIAGSVVETLTPEQCCVPGIRPVGYVDDLRPEYERATIAVAPLRFGGGLKIKTLEALAHGLPVVTTPVGSQGMEKGNNTCMFIAECGTSIAHAMVRACIDLELNQSMRTAAFEFVTDQFSPSVAYEPLMTLLGQSQGVAA